MTPTSTPIAQAVRLLRAAAKDIKDCHTRGDEDWAGEPEALAAHDEHIAVAQALELIEQPIDDLSKRLIATCRHALLTWEDRKALGEAIARLQAATPAQHHVLRDLLNRRPAINVGLDLAYARWNAECYQVMGAQANAAANDTPPQEVAYAHVRQAIRDYHFALDSRMHGILAADKALKAIEAALGTHWVQGKELAARAAPGAAP